jgi:hypothetical protein
MYSKSKIVFFATLDNNDTTITTTKSTNETSNNVKQDKTKYSKDDNINKPEYKKNATKKKIMAMLIGQIKSEIVDVQKEFDKIGGYTIERTFAFDRNTDMSPIQIGDRDIMPM